MAGLQGRAAMPGCKSWRAWRVLLREEARLTVALGLATRLGNAAVLKLPVGFTLFAATGESAALVVIMCRPGFI